MTIGARLGLTIALVAVLLIAFVVVGGALGTIELIILAAGFLIGLWGIWRA